MTTDHSISSQQENAESTSKFLPAIAPCHKNMRTNFLILSMLLNGNPACAKHDLTFASHLSGASMALLNRAMQGITGINEIWVIGRNTLLPAQPWVLWAFVIQELCKTVICLLSRKPSEVLLLSVHPLEPVDCTLLEWEHHPSYAKWVSPHPPNSPVNVSSLLEHYATSLKAVMGLLMIYVARMFGPTSATSGDFNILGYKDSDLPVDALRNFNFGDPEVTVKNSPGIFIYEAGINVIETCKVLEADKYDEMANELKQVLVEAIFSNMTHMYPEKMQADLTAVEQRVIPPIDKPHALRATASEFHPGYSESPSDGAACRNMLPDIPPPSSRLSRPSARTRSVYRTSQSMRIPVDRSARPSTATRLTVQRSGNPTRPQGRQGDTSPAYSAQVAAQSGPLGPPTTGTDSNSLTPTAQPGYQIPQAIGAHLFPSASPTLPLGFQIPQAFNPQLLPSIADPRVQISQAAIIQREEQLFHECRQIAQRLLGLPVSPNLPPPLSFLPSPSSWYYPPTVVNPGPLGVFLPPPATNLPVYWPPTFPGRGSDSQTPAGSQNLPGQEAYQRVTSLFSLLNPSEIPNTGFSATSPQPDAHAPTIIGSQDPHPTPSQSSTSEVQRTEPSSLVCPAEGPAPVSSVELSQRRSARAQRRSRYSNRGARIQGRPLALHVDDLRGRPWRRENP
ncbi:hypothetical protein FGG08_002887 [Glutinoglossum americanum]|uniref:Uncharacterized protein n=1 Tax=Glutinoglossum americanum TaxID=1670608 RepID=A0A9P8I8E8_9PEZI|nr:hypothetical protein FGG08_002887 [Glutinoglossum americanum]